MDKNKLYFRLNDELKVQDPLGEDVIYTCYESIGGMRRVTWPINEEVDNKFGIADKKPETFYRAEDVDYAIEKGLWVVIKGIDVNA